MSLLKPKLITTELPPLVGLRIHSSNRFDTCTFYSWTTDPDFLGKDSSVVIVSDDFNQAWQRLLELHPSELGTCRVFPIRHHNYIHVPPSIQSQLAEFAANVPKLSSFSSGDTPHSAHIVAFNKPIITTEDPSLIRDIVLRHGQLPSTHPRLPDDPLFPVVQAKATFHPGSLPIFMDDSNGRIRTRRARKVDAKALKQYPLGELLNPSYQPFAKLATEAFEKFLNRLSDRRRGLFHRSPYRDYGKLHVAKRYGGHAAPAFHFENAATRSERLHAPAFPGKFDLDSIDWQVCHTLDDFFETPEPNNIFFRFCKEDPELRAAALEFCLTFTSFVPTLFYLLHELHPSPDARFHRILSIVFAVARMARHLTPSPQEIRYVRERQPDFPDPEPYLAAFRKRRK